jgi:hypothetical protein
MGGVAREGRKLPGSALPQGVNGFGEEEVMQRQLLAVVIELEVSEGHIGIIAEFVSRFTLRGVAT